jgi:hypothetical protein
MSMRSTPGCSSCAQLATRPSVASRPPGDLYADLDSDRLFDRTNCQVALATVGTLVQRSIRDFVA